MKDKKKILYLLVAVVILLGLVISASYAYFEVSTKGTSISVIIKGKTDKLGIITIENIIDRLHLNLSSSDMNINEEGNYYADEHLNYVTSEEEGLHRLSKIEITNGDN